MQMRPADMDDIPTLVALRKQQLIDEDGGLQPIAEIDRHLAEYFASAMADGSLVVWVTEVDSEIIATGAVCFYALPPTFLNPTGRVAYITSMYTKNEYRCRGIATELLGMAICEAKARGCRVLRLHASENGRSIYQKAGFIDSDGYMAMKIG